MSDNHLKYLMEHADDLVPVLYAYARELARRKFWWVPGKALPLGKTPEDIVTDVFQRYAKGGTVERARTKGVRHFDPAKDITIQLKGSVRSLMSALADRASTRNEALACSEEEAQMPLDAEPTDATPAEIAESRDFAKVVVEGLRAHPKVMESKELQDLLAALELDITEVAAQAEELRMTEPQIHQLRHRLRAIYHEVIDKENRY